MKGNALFHRRLDYEYPLITHGKGIYLYDDEGNRYIDAVGGAMVANLGHGIDEIAQKSAEYIHKYSYLHASQFSAPHIEEFAQKLINVAPPHIDKVYFVSGGSEAVETAVKLAYQYSFAKNGHHAKRKVIYTNPSYHGSTMMALSLTGKFRGQDAFQGLLFDFPVIQSPTCYRCPYNQVYPECNLYCASFLEEKILEENPETIAAFIVEPVIGASTGVCIPPEGYLERIRSICNRYDIVLIFDEILCGYGRTGKWFASEHWNVTPNIVIHGKGISAGIVPLAAVYCSNEIVEVIKERDGNFSHGYTYTNHQYTTAIGNLVFDYIQKHALINNVVNQGNYLLEQLLTLESLDIIGQVRGLGLLTGIELVQDKVKKTTFSRDKKVAERVVQHAMKNGLNLYFSNGYTDTHEGDSIIIAPPYNVKKEEIDEIISILKNTLSAI